MSGYICDVLGEERSKVLCYVLDVNGD